MENMSSEDAPDRAVITTKLRSPSQVSETNTMDSFQDGGQHNMNSEQTEFPPPMDGSHVNSDASSFSQNSGEQGVTPENYGRMNENIHPGQLPGFSMYGRGNFSMGDQQHGGMSLSGSSEFSSQSSQYHGQYTQHLVRPTYPGGHKPGMGPMRPGLAGTGIGMMPPTYNPAQTRMMSGQSISQQSGPTPTLNQLLQSPNSAQRYQNNYAEYGSGPQKVPADMGGVAGYPMQQAWSPSQRGMNAFPQSQAGISGCTGFRNQSGSSMAEMAQQRRVSGIPPNYPQQAGQYSGQQFSPNSQRYVIMSGSQGRPTGQINMSNQPYGQQIPGQFIQLPNQISFSPSMSQSQPVHQQPTPQQQPQPPGPSPPHHSPQQPPPQQSPQPTPPSQLPQQPHPQPHSHPHPQPQPQPQTAPPVLQSQPNQSPQHNQQMSPQLKSELKSERVSNAGVGNLDEAKVTGDVDVCGNSSQPSDRKEHSSSFDDLPSENSRGSQGTPTPSGVLHAGVSNLRVTSSPAGSTGSRSNTPASITGNQAGSPMPPRPSSSQLDGQNRMTHSPMATQGFGQHMMPPPVGPNQIVYGGSNKASPISGLGGAHLGHFPQYNSHYPGGNYHRQQNPPGMQNYSQQNVYNGPNHMYNSMSMNRNMSNSNYNSAAFSSGNMNAAAMAAQYGSYNSQGVGPSAASMAIQGQSSSVPGVKGAQAAAHAAMIAAANSAVNRTNTLRSVPGNQPLVYIPQGLSPGPVNQTGSASYPSNINHIPNSASQYPNSMPQSPVPNTLNTSSVPSTTPPTLNTCSTSIRRTSTPESSSNTSMVSKEGTVPTCSEVSSLSSTLNSVVPTSSADTTSQHSTETVKSDSTEAVVSIGCATTSSNSVAAAAQLCSNNRPSPSSLSIDDSHATTTTTANSSAGNTNTVVTQSITTPVTSVVESLSNDSQPDLLPVYSIPPMVNSTPSDEPPEKKKKDGPSVLTDDLRECLIVPNATSKHMHRSPTPAAHEIQSSRPRKNPNSMQRSCQFTNTIWVKPKNKDCLSHLPTPSGIAPSPGGNSYPEEFENLSSPLWSGTPVETPVNMLSLQKKPGQSGDLHKLYSMGDEPERKLFLDRLLFFMEEKGTPITSMPQISKQPLDLFKLYLNVKEKGGMVEVNKAKKWKEICGVVNIGSSASAAFTLKRNYIKYLFAYECKFDKDGIDPQPILAQMEAALQQKRESKQKRAPSPAGSQGSSQDAFRPPSTPNNSNSQGMDPFSPNMQQFMAPNSEPNMGPMGAGMMGPGSMAGMMGNNSVGGPNSGMIPPHHMSSGPNSMHGSMMPGVPPNSMMGNSYVSSNSMMGSNMGPTSNMMGPGNTMIASSLGPPNIGNSGSNIGQSDSDSVSVQDPFADEPCTSGPSYPRQSLNSQMPPYSSMQSQTTMSGMYGFNRQATPHVMPPFSNMNQQTINNFPENRISTQNEQFSENYRRTINMENFSGNRNSENFVPGSTQFGPRSGQSSAGQFPFGQQFDRERFEQSSANSTQQFRPPSQASIVSPQHHPDQMYPTRFSGSQQMTPVRSHTPQHEQYPPNSYSNQGGSYGSPRSIVSQEQFQGFAGQQGSYPTHRTPVSREVVAGNMYGTPSKRYPAEVERRENVTISTGYTTQMGSFSEKPVSSPVMYSQHREGMISPQDNQIPGGYKGSHPIGLQAPNYMSMSHPHDDFLDSRREAGQWSTIPQRFGSQHGGSSYVPPGTGMLPPMVPPGPGSTGRTINPRMSPQRDKPYMSPPRVQKPGGVVPNAQLPPKKEISFPPDSVEAVQPLLAKRKRLAKQDIGQTEPWKLMMALKSGLLAESTWALDTLSILLFDDSTVAYFSLSHLPGLIEVLLEHFRRCLIEIFGLFDELEIGYEYLLKKMEKETSLTDDVDSENDRLWKNVRLGENYTMVTRRGKCVKLDENAKDSALLDRKEWDLFSGFSSRADHWQLGGGDFTSHIQTHFESSDNQEVFKKLFYFHGLKSANSKTENENDVMESREICESSEETDCIKEEQISLQDGINVNCVRDSEKLRNNYINKVHIKTEPVDPDEQKDLTAAAPVSPLQDACKEECHSDYEKQNVQKSEVNTKEFKQPHLSTDDVDDDDLELEEEAFERDIPALCLTSEAQEETGRRCVCISNIFRSLSCIPGNDSEMSKHPGLMYVLGKLLLLHHQHPPRVKVRRKLDKEENDLDENASISHGEHEWWWDYLHALRENTLVIFANICGQLDLSMYPEEICLPIFDGLLHWAVCPAACARDPLPSMSPSSVLSPQRLVLEALCKLGIHEANVDLLLATPPFDRIVQLLSNLTKMLANKKEQVTQEFAIVLLSELVQGDNCAARAIAMQHPSVSLLIDFLETAEQNAVQVVNTHGIHVLRDSPEMMGTSLDMLRRTANILVQLARVPENRSLFVHHQNRLLTLVMSQILDQHVAQTLADVLYECSNS